MVIVCPSCQKAPTSVLRRAFFIGFTRSGTCQHCAALLIPVRSIWRSIVMLVVIFVPLQLNRVHGYGAFISLLLLGVAAGGFVIMSAYWPLRATNDPEVKRKRRIMLICLWPLLLLSCIGSFLR
jgi:hypothetical protein